MDKKHKIKGMQIRVLARLTSSRGLEDLPHNWTATTDYHVDTFWMAFFVFLTSSIEEGAIN